MPLRADPVKRKYTAVCLLLVLTLVLLLAACSGQEDGGEGKTAESKDAESSQGAPAVPADPVVGGRLIMGSIGDATNLIPPLSSDAFSHELSSYLYVGLLKYDKDLNIVPEAAESYEVLEGGKKLRFTLRKDIFWQDGVQLTARDVEFTYQLMVDPATPTAYAGDYMAIKEFTLLDEFSFEVRYETPFARSLITWMHDILPRHRLEGKDLMTSELAREPLSCGERLLVSWDTGSRVTLDANPDYFEGRPYIDQLVYNIIPDLATMFLELKAGNLDYMGLTPQQYLHQTNSPDFEENFNKYRYLSFSYMYLGYNLTKPPFNDANVRRALAHALSKEDIVKGVYLGEAEPAIGPYKPGTWVYNSEVTDYPFDPEKARTMLATSGWTDSDGDGVLDKDGKDFAFTIMTNQGNDLRVKAATILQSRFGDIGIKVKIQTVEWATFLKEYIDKGRFEAIVMGWNILQDPDVYDVWHSSRAFEGGLNFIGYKNARVDELLEAARTTLDRAERKTYYDEFQELLHRDQPYAFLAVPYAHPVVHARVQGVSPAPAGITHNFKAWWVPKNLQRFSFQP